MESLHQPEDIIADRYRIVTRLGQGGIGTTYEAEDLTNYQRVAIKAVSLRQMEDWKVLELFEREARVLANLHYPQIPKYLNYFHVDNDNDRRFYLVQELIGGDSLANLVQKGWQVDEAKAKRIAVQVLTILKYLHSLMPPVIHRDIKPQNIILRRDGRIFLVDFGAVQDVYRYTVSRGGTFVGTLGFMPPEQLRGKVVPASDLYSLGATLLFLLTKKWPDELPQRRMKIDFRSQVNISHQFADWLEKILEPLVEDRFISATEALAALQGKVQITPTVKKMRSQPISDRKTIEKTNKNQFVEVPPPAGSRIILKKTNKTFRFEMLPPRGWMLIAPSCASIIFIFAYNLFAIPLLGILFDSLQIILAAGSSLIIGKIVTLLLYFVPYLIVILPILDKFVFRREYIEIDSNHCRLSSRGLYYKGQRILATEDIELVEIKINVDSDGSKTTSCVIWEGVQQYTFGSNLTESEKQWLATQMSNFIDLLKASANRS